MARRGKAALSVVRDTEPDQVGDAEVRVAHLAELSQGQAECREERRHRYGRPTGLVYARSLKNLPLGTRILITQECARCFCVKRSADHVVTRRGLRQVEDWKSVYREHKGVAYLMPKGAGRLDEGDIEELKGRKYLGENGKMRMTLVSPDE